MTEETTNLCHDADALVIGRKVIEMALSAKFIASLAPGTASFWSFTGEDDTTFNVRVSVAEPDDTQEAPVTSG